MNDSLARHSGEKVDCSALAQNVVKTRIAISQFLDAMNNANFPPIPLTASSTEIAAASKELEKLTSDLVQTLPTFEPIKAISPRSELQAHIDWAFRTKSAPCGDCASDRAACCISGCVPQTLGNGWLARDQIAAQAALSAKNGACIAAVGILLQTQCHNTSAVTVLASHPNEVCEILKRH